MSAPMQRAPRHKLQIDPLLGLRVSGRYGRQRGRKTAQIGRLSREWRIFGSIVAMLPVPLRSTLPRFRLGPVGKSALRDRLERPNAF